VKALFIKEGAFWLMEYTLVIAAVYSAVHPFRRRTLLSKPFCFLIGHCWEILDRDPIRWSLNHQSFGDTLAGSRCTCQRCFREWSDLPTAEELADRNRPVAPPPPAPPPPVSSDLDSTKKVEPKSKRSRPRKKAINPTRFERVILDDEKVTESVKLGILEGTNTLTPPLEPEDSKLP
jgi:hypothetical protein